MLRISRKYQGFVDFRFPEIHLSSMLDIEDFIEMINQKL
jgi:hypothetical protein